MVVSPFYLALIMGILHVSLSFVQFGRTSNSNGAIYRRRRSSLNDSNEPPEKKKSTKFDRIIDDFVGKKYGAGEAFYGKRMSGLSEEEYALLQDSGKQKKESVEDYDSKPMRPNAVLVLGEPSDDVVSWISLELLEKGFSVRIAMEDRPKAIGEMGLPGYNIDMVELKADSDDYLYARAVEDVQAILICSNLEPVPSPFVNKAKSTMTVAGRLLEITRRAQTAKVNTVQKITMVSRYVPAVDGYEMGAPNPLSAVAGTAASIANNLFTGTVNVQEPVYQPFQSLHEQMEQQVRDVGIEYSIVRAPPVVLKARPGAMDTMAALSSDEISALLRPAAGSSAPSPLVLSVGALDLAEAAVQSLLLEEVEGMSFTVCARSAGASSSSRSDSAAEVPAVAVPAMSQKRSPTSTGTGSGGGGDMDSLGGLRASRQTYYSILSLDDSTDPIADIRDVVEEPIADKYEQQRLEQEREASNAASYRDMRATYMIRPPDAYRSQLEEDEAVERYWISLLKNLPKDDQ